ncbi:oligosaccharide flippase family protein [Siphonobacter sp. BAB-5385]|uniref:oligosaccharide flippase family protein n=1 Tax=Siphonobacter sp. BAB-5385 TaxID=1864822 RepID=UPI001595B940|nr:oligosaccharide flippase family protein [Siphonobacter sp. BAB-5385]
MAFFDKIYADLVDINALDTIYQILPYALTTLFIMSISSVLSSFIDGYEKSHLKLIANSISLVVYIASAYFFIKSYDLIGVAMAQLIQSIIYFLLLVVALKIVCPTITNISWRWDTTIFKEIILFSGQLQLISILVLLFEPITNLFIVKFAGLEVLGFYEMANRLISQIKNMLTQANQALIPVIAKVNEKSTSTVNQIYTKVLNFMMELSTYVFVLTIILAYFISYIWIGYINKIFISSLIILCVGNYFNILSVPAYFSSMGTGKLKTILVSHIIMTVSNVLLGYLLGYIYMENGIIIAKCISLLVGSFYIIHIYHYHNKMSNYDLININIFLLLSFICSIGIGFTIMYFVNDWLAVTSVFLMIYSFWIIKYSSRNSSILNQLKNI